MKKIITTAVVCVLSASLLALGGCSTVQGFGKDVSKGGREIQRAAS